MERIVAEFYGVDMQALQSTIEEQLEQVTALQSQLARAEQALMLSLKQRSEFLSEQREC